MAGDPTLADVMAELAALRVEIAELRTEREQTASRQLVDAATLARELGVKRRWVYAHSDRLGAEPLTEPGDGRKPRLRFDVDKARLAFARDPDEETAPAKSISRSPRRKRETRAGHILRVRET